MELLAEIKKTIIILNKVNNEFLQIGKDKKIKIIDYHPNILNGMLQKEEIVSDSSFDELVNFFQAFIGYQW